MALPYNDRPPEVEAVNIKEGDWHPVVVEVSVGINQKTRASDRVAGEVSGEVPDEMSGEVSDEVSGAVAVT